MVLSLQYQPSADICCSSGRDNSLYSWLLRIVPSWVLWNICKARNKVIFDSGTMCHDKINDQIHLLYTANKLQLRREKATIEAINFFGVSTVEEKISMQAVL